MDDTGRKIGDRPTQRLFAIELALVYGHTGSFQFRPLPNVDDGLAHGHTGLVTIGKSRQIDLLLLGALGHARRGTLRRIRAVAEAQRRFAAEVAQADDAL